MCLLGRSGCGSTRPMSFVKGAHALLSLPAVALLLSIVGCEESARRPLQVRPPQVAAGAPPERLGPLPIDPRRAGVRPLAVQAPRGVELLLAKVEAAFRNGQQEYKAGHLVKARREFDQALDWLLLSGYDLQADARLEDLFDRIVDTVHAYEMQSFREGDGFSEQKAEPAPIDEIAEMTVPSPESLDPRLGARLAKVLEKVPHDLPLTLNDHVLSNLNFFPTP